MLSLGQPADRPLRLLALGAHPDDIEIGATILQLADCSPALDARYVVMTGEPLRQAEARRAAAAFLPGAALKVESHSLAEGRLPVQWGQVKEILEVVATEFTPDRDVAGLRRPVRRYRETV
jgi:LmbE family N-acetylglucosaminyl deacetylase